MTIISLDDLSLCERGNTLLVDGPNMVAWLSLQGSDRLEVSWCPDNYPALTVQVVRISDAELATHINTELVDWTILKCQLSGVTRSRANQTE